MLLSYLFSLCSIDDQLVDRCTVQPFGIIDVGAFFILGKRAPGFFFIAVNLPTTAAFTAVSLMKNEAVYILFFLILSIGYYQFCFRRMFFFGYLILAGNSLFDTKDSTHFLLFYEKYFVFLNNSDH